MATEKRRSWDSGPSKIRCTAWGTKTLPQFHSGNILLLAASAPIRNATFFATLETTTSQRDNRHFSPVVFSQAIHIFFSSDSHFFLKREIFVSLEDAVCLLFPNPQPGNSGLRPVPFSGHGIMPLAPAGFQTPPSRPHKNVPARHSCRAPATRNQCPASGRKAAPTR